MTGRRMVGVVVMVAGIFALAVGGVFWTDRDTVLDAGPLQVQTEDREGVVLPPLLGGALLRMIAGLFFMVVPFGMRSNAAENA